MVIGHWEELINVHFFCFSKRIYFLSYHEKKGTKKSHRCQGILRKDCFNVNQNLVLLRKFLKVVNDERKEIENIRIIPE